MQYISGTPEDFAEMNTGGYGSFRIEEADCYVALAHFTHYSELGGYGRVDHHFCDYSFINLDTDKTTRHMIRGRDITYNDFVQWIAAQTQEQAK